MPPHPAVALQAALERLVPLAGTTYRDRLLAQLDGCRRLVRHKLAPQVRADGQPALCVFAGGTNVGKTSLANAATGAVLGRPSPVARATRAAVLLAHEEEAHRFLRADFLPGYARRRLHRAEQPEAPDAACSLLLATHADPELRSLAVADSPDIDSVLEQNHRVAEDLLFAADALVFVASEEKYNDEVCVRFLERALRHGKTVLAVLNKHTAPEALADFRDHVVAAAARGRASSCPSPRVLAIPYRPGASGLAAAAAPLAAALRELAAEAPGLAARARAGAREGLAAEAAEPLRLLRAERAALAAYREQVQALAHQAARRFAADTARLPVPELERVLALLADALHLPVVDDAYLRMRRLTAPVRDFLVHRLLGRPDPAVRAAARLAQRDRAEAEAAEIRLREALAEVRQLPERHPSELAPALAAALLPAAEAEPLGLPGPEFAAALRAHAAGWVDGVLRELHRELRQHPAKFRLARALKAVLRTGIAAGELALTGSIGLSDALLVPVLDAAAKAGVEKAFGRLYLERRLAAFRAERAALFEAMVRERLARVALERLGGPEPQALGAFERALEQLVALPLEAEGSATPAPPVAEDALP